MHYNAKGGVGDDENYNSLSLAVAYVANEAGGVLAAGVLQRDDDHLSQSIAYTAQCTPLPLSGGGGRLPVSHSSPAHPQDIDDRLEGTPHLNRARRKEENFWPFFLYIWLDPKFHIDHRLGGGVVRSHLDMCDDPVIKPCLRPPPQSSGA
jgi:hypothetical protein